MKSSALSRSFELAKLAARVGLKEFGSGDFKSRIEQARLISNSLSNLKGAAMKAGQLLSLDLDHYFPPEAIEILSQLQNAAVAQPFEEIESLIRSQLAQDKFNQIKNISKVPIGVASIGQVHKAQIENRNVVLKVQYRDVADSIDSDLKILKTLAYSFCQLSGRKMDLDPLFKEFRHLLTQEVDYRIEAHFQKQYQKNMLGFESSGQVQLHVPNVIEEFSTQKLLVMNFEEGLPLRSWIASNPSKEQRIQMAYTILDLYFHEFFKCGLVQTDPNWGNFLVSAKENNLKLCLLDFGATKTYSRDFIQGYRQLLSLAAENKKDELKAHAIHFGLIDKREADSAFQALQNLLSVAIKPFFTQKSGAQYFDFADRNHTLESKNAAQALARELVYSPPPYTIIFLHRKLAGVYSVLKSLDVQMDISSYWQMMKDLSVVDKQDHRPQLR